MAWRVIGKPADFQGLARLGREGHPHAVQIQHPHQRISEARGYAFLIGVDPHGRKRRQRRHIAERSAQRLQFTAVDLIRLAQLSRPPA